MIIKSSNRCRWPNDLIFTVYEVPKDRDKSFNLDPIYIGEYLMSCRDLTREEYLVLEMAYRHKKSSIDIADMLDVEERNVQVLKYNALSKLKKSKEKEEIDAEEARLKKQAEYRRIMQKYRATQQTKNS